MTLRGIHLADAAGLTVETVEMADAAMDWTAVVLGAVGLVVLGLWLWRYGGYKALHRAPVRRHCVPLWLPFMLFFAWFLLFFQLITMVDAFYGDPQAAEATAARNLMMLVLNTAMIGVLLAAGHGLFARRLKGFGLHPKTLPGDAGWAAVNLLAVYPLVIAGMGVALLVGRLLKGEGFMIETHQSLEELMGFEQVWGRFLVIVLVAAVVPVMEELLFRGLMQTTIRSVTGGAWPAVLLTSALFAVVHSPTHAPAIFALSCGLGYAYERSGSLWRPIFMHVLFNSISVAGSLL